MLGFVTGRLRFMESIAPRLTAFQLTLRAGTRTLVDALDLTLEPGEVLGILGANGAGKSTLLNVLAGLASPAQGGVTLDGHALDALPPLTRAQHIGLLPQGDEGGFFGSVADFVMLGHYPFDRASGDFQHFRFVVVHAFILALAAKKFAVERGEEPHPA